MEGQIGENQGRSSRFGNLVYNVTGYLLLLNFTI